MKLFRDESGQTLVLAALSLIGLLGFMGLALDVGMLLHNKRNMQIAADAAALAGAGELPNTDYRAVAQGAAIQNRVTDGTNGTVKINGATGTGTGNSGPSTGTFSGNTAYVEAIVSQTESTVFMGLFGPGTLTVTARAVATRGGPASTCIYALKGPGTTQISFGENGNVSVPNCAIIDDGNLSYTANGNVTAKSIGYAGSYSGGGNGTITPPVKISPVGDPLGFLQAPSPSGCVVDPVVKANAPTTLGPGCYNGLTFKGNGNLTLTSGTYVINGNLDLRGNGSITGTDVTFILLGTTNFANNGNVTLSAPTSGSENGLLFFQPKSNTDNVTLSNNGNLNMRGILYFPTANVTLSGNGSGSYLDFVVQSLTLSSNGSFNDYATINSSNILSSLALVE